MLLILDSRVAVGAIGKGRSSSVGLNSALSIFLRLRVLFGITVCVLWVSTGANPPDAPSRHAPPPLPKPLLQSFAPLISGNSIIGLDADSNRKTRPSKETDFTPENTTPGRTI